MMDDGIAAIAFRLLEGELALEGEGSSPGLFKRDLGTSDPLTTLAGVRPGQVKVL